MSIAGKQSILKRSSNGWRLSAFHALCLFIIAGISGCVSVDPERPPSIDTKYRLSDGGPGIAKDLEGIAFSIAIEKAGDMFPVKNDLNLLRKALEQSIRNHAGYIDSDNPNALRVHVRTSRYQNETLPRMPRDRRNRTLIDFNVTVSSSWDDDHSSGGVRSIQEFGVSPTRAHENAIERFVAMTFESALRQPIERYQREMLDPLSHRMRHLSGQLHNRLADVTASSVPQSPEMTRIALIPLQGDVNGRVYAALLPELMARFTPPDYQFYTRSRFEEILNEQVIQMSDLIDGTTAAEPGRLQGVDLLICGAVNQSGDSTVVQLEIVSVETGEILGAVSTEW